MPLPLDKRQHRQRLSIRHRRDPDIPVEIQIGTHRRAKGDVFDFPVRSDLGDDALQSRVGSREVLLALKVALCNASAPALLWNGKEMAHQS
jgi:hypothetical protein